MYSYNSAAKWVAVSSNWEQMAVTDVKIVFMPSNLRGAINNGLTIKEEGLTHTMEVFEDVNTYNTPNYSDN